MAGDTGKIVAVAALFGGAVALVVGSRHAHAQARLDRGGVRSDPPRPPPTSPPTPPLHSTSFGPVTGPPGSPSLPTWLSPLAPYIPSGDARPPGMGTWQSAMTPRCLEFGIQPGYAAQWVRMESGGNPCAVGYPPAHGPDGNPKEIGIAQFYNPDDLDALGLTGSELRAYCVPGDQHPTVYKNKRVIGFSQDMTRAMTPAEIARQADATVALIRRSMASATRDLTAAHAGAAWSPRHRDYWAVVKLQHGLPQISRLGFAAAARMLGRPPAGWAEFRRAVDRIKLDPENEKKYREYIPAIMENAERCADAFVEEDPSV